MKICIITLHRVFNYGSALQAYATQKIFEQTGNEVEIIDYVTEQRTFKKLLLMTPSSINNKLKKNIYIIFKFFSLLIKHQIFGGFIKKYLNLTSEKYTKFIDLCDNPPQADIYITGSDQVWNSHYNEGIDKGFFLEFVKNNKKKIAYASSFGREELDTSELEETRKLLKKYSKIAVREDSAIKILNKLGIEDSIHVLDPTLQLEKEIWMRLACKRIIKDNYLLLILLYNEDNGGIEYAQKIAQKKGLKIVKLSWEFKKPKGVDILMTHRSPEVFLSLFQHADFVITNSFHGLAFSINFNKQFLVIPRNEYNTRLESLLRLVGLEDRIINHTSMINKCDKEIKYDKINKIINNERKKTFKFIKDVVGESGL
jgi:polysaccharide pyruvyl transferase WcaK-like protein